jgi:hypothetical protein
MVFKLGDSVKVKKDVMCPDYESLCIGGWQGRIFDIDDVIGIRWDSVTLKQLPVEYIKHSEEEGLGWSEMYLSADEIEPASPRDSEEEVDEILEEMETRYFWLGEGKEGERILKVIGDAEDAIEAWRTHLSQVLRFQFEAEVSEFQEKGPLNVGDHVQVHGLNEVDDPYGILVDVTFGRKRYVFPLCDLTVQDKKSSNYLSVKDYCVWFANR